MRIHIVIACFVTENFMIVSNVYELCFYFFSFLKFKNPFFPLIFLPFYIHTYLLLMSFGINSFRVYVLISCLIFIINFKTNLYKKTVPGISVFLTFSCSA